MADFVFSFVNTAPQTLSGGESGVITASGGLYSDGADAVTATGGTNWLTVDGLLYAFNGGYSAVDADGSVFKMLIGQNGLITAENPTGGTIDLDLSSHGEVVNHGSVYSSNDEAIRFDASDPSASFQLNNTGSIVSQTGSAVTGHVGGGWHYFNNSGHIAGGSSTVSLSADVSNSATHTLVNSGSIHSEDSIGVYLALGDSSAAHFSNSGTITGVFSAINSSGNGNVDLTNSGTIETLRPFLNSAVRLGGGDDNLTNTGLIVGVVSLGAGMDLFDGRGGQVTRDVQGGAGDDTYIVDDAGLSLVELSGEGTDLVQSLVNWTLGDHFENLDLLGSDDLNATGNDEFNLINGNAGANRIQGHNGDDTVNGGFGEDTIAGGGRNDRLIGGSGDDIIWGQTGEDNVSGGHGDDWVAGNAGDDRIVGNDGDDTLVGGTGADALNGGDGADVFLYRWAIESPNSTQSDKIRGFVVGEDVIDLGAVADGTLDFIGSSAFSGTGPELRINTYAGGTNSRIRVDVDGDGVADMRIDVIGTTGLTAEEFVL